MSKHTTKLPPLNPQHINPQSPSISIYFHSRFR